MNNNSNQSGSSKPVEIYQLVVASVMLLLVFIAAIIGTNERITSLEIKQINDDEYRKEVKEYFNKINASQTEILIKLENKENRANK
jgi:hypothetical protein